MQYRLRLASTSPRRRALLPLLGFPVESLAVNIDERPRESESPAQTALRLAEAKALASGPPLDNQQAVVGADTIVVLEDAQLGKPTDAADAHRMLAELRGRRHQVITGVALMGADQTHCGSVTTNVRMRAYTDDEIEQYVASGRSLDKAGAYAIQDTDFAPVERIDGCYLNVVGLPLCAVSRGLRALGWPLADERLEPPCRFCLAGQEALNTR